MSQEVIKELDVVDKLLKKLSLKSFILLLLAVLLFIAYNRGIALIYALVALISATYIVAYLTPRFALRSIAVSRVIKKHATQGQVLKLRYRLTHKHFLARYMVVLQDKIPFTEQYNNDFLIPILNNETTIEHKLTCDIRGEHVLGPITLESGFPLGINTSKITIANSEVTTLVYPQYFNIKKIPLSANLKNLHQGDYPIEKVSGIDEFIGVREYRHGDPIKHIHWVSSAKRDELIVKEFNNVNESSISIVLDLHHNKNFGKGVHTTLEYAVKITTSLAIYAIQNSIALNIYAEGSRIVNLQNLRAKEDIERVLEAMARVKSDGKVPYEHVINTFISSTSNSATLVLFQNNEKLDPILSYLEQKRHNIFLFNFKTYSFTKEPTPNHVKHYWHKTTHHYEIFNGADLEEMFQ